LHLDVLPIESLAAVLANSCNDADPALTPGAGKIEAANVTGSDELPSEKITRPAEKVTEREGGRAGSANLPVATHLKLRMACKLQPR
jgi:hypothetical protein